MKMDLAKVINNFTILSERIVRIAFTILFDEKDLIKFFTSSRTSIDERLNKFDDIKTYLMEAAAAVEDLKTQAEENKAAKERLLADLSVLQENQRQVQEETRAISEATKADVEAFRKLAGIPSENEIKKNRIWGFIGGVVASLVAAVIWWAGEALVKFLL